MTPLENVARILRADKNYLAGMNERLVQATGRQDVLEKLVEENELLMGRALSSLGIARQVRAKEAYDALIAKIGADDSHIFASLGKPDSRSTADCQRIADLVREAVSPPKGLFLKLDKAREFLTKEPPKQVLGHLGYATVEEMLEKEDIYEIYSSLRFIEGNEWLNSVFFKQYEHLTPTDFEEREIVVRALGDRWATIAQKFVAKKRHNISHLKELGVVFIIPTTLGIPGEILRMITLVGHYLYEVPFYADMFRRIVQEPQTFATNFVSLLRGDVPESRHLVEDPAVWLVVQRYLAKDDENDWRLGSAHVNPEALHWAKAIAMLPKAVQLMGASSTEIAFWSDLGWVGNYFEDESGVEVLISFDLVDTVMSLVQQKEMVKYLYHHQESLWNKIFVSYFGVEEIEKRSREALLQGYFSISPKA